MAWIRSGELVAVNLAHRNGGRPRYKIDPEELQAFLLRRQVIPPAKPIRRPRRRDDSITRYF